MSGLGLSTIKSMMKRVLPASATAAWRRRFGFNVLNRPTPVNRLFGLDRGLPIDRHYIRTFLQRHAMDIRGRVLEIGDDGYTRMFGGERVTRCDVLHATPGNPKATIIGDLAKGDSLPSNAFDCMICTQTLMFIYDLPAAVRTIHRILKPDGVLLLTVAGISQICRFDMEHWGDFWRFTNLSVQRMLEGSFAAPNIKVEPHGNALAAVAFLQGLALEDIDRRLLGQDDPDYQLIIGARAVKGATDDRNSESGAA